MKNLLLLFLMAGFALGCSSGKHVKSYSAQIASVKSEYMKITESLYVADGEVSNGEYLQFLNWLETNGKKEELEKCNVDSNGWRRKLSFCEPLVLYYHRHPAYKDYPVVNVSYEGATAYCKWLTEEYHKNLSRKFNKVQFRLPAEDEWKLAAKGGNPTATFPWKGIYMRNEQGEFMANFVNLMDWITKDTVIEGVGKVFIASGYEDVKMSPLSGGGIYTTPVRSYWKNGYGLYNMAGNVSEMLQEKGRTKGGNWGSYGYYLRIDADDEFGGDFGGTSPRVGFRVFMEVLEK